MLTTKNTGPIRTARSALIALVLSVVASGPVAAGIEIRADYIFTDHDARRLHLSLWNCTAKPLRIPGVAAPWGDKAITMALYRATDMKPESWEPLPLMIHLRPPDSVVEPGQKTSGDVPLWFMPLAATSKDQGPFVLFWSYNTGRLGEKPARQLSGALNIGIGGDEHRTNGSPCSSAGTALKGH